MIRQLLDNSIYSRKIRPLAGIGALSATIAAAAITTPASALELDWSGQFRAEYNFIHNYGLDSSDAASSFDATRAAAGGYYIPSGGTSDASFQTVFLRLRPKLVVNDNVYIKSEWWLGDPVYGMFGNAAPYALDQKQFYSNQSRGSVITAQRFWGEFVTDIGTLVVGRAPLHWGLGLVWNNGDGLWDRYVSTADRIALISKFGAFSLIPSFNLYSAGLNIGGGATFTPGATPSDYLPRIGEGGVREYSLALKYENLEEDFEGGVNFIKRLAGAAQDPNSGYYSPIGRAAAAMNYNIWDIYAKKRIGKFTLAAEAPVTSGTLGTPGGAGLDYSTFALATELGWKPNDTFELALKAGHAPGQPSFAGAVPDNFRAFFFNPAYRLGLIMFNYQLASFVGPNTQNDPALGADRLKSPYDNPIVNANYMMWSGLIHTDKWTFDLDVLYARAVESAKAGQSFYNTTIRDAVANNAGVDQGSSLGVETDLGATFQWDENFLFRVRAGLFFPGDYWRFSNVAGQENATSTAFATSVGIGVVF